MISLSDQLQSLHRFFSPVVIWSEKLGGWITQPTLQILSLNENTIGAEGAQGLAVGLSGSALQILYLGSNRIGDEGAKGLGTGLPGSALQALYLNNNDISAEGVKALAAGLPGSALRVVDLSNSDIDDEGAEAIAAELITTVQVKSQSSWLTTLNPDIKRALAQAEPNTNLTYLALGSNKINTTGAKALCRVLP